MSKYNKGDKFIVEIKEVMESDNGTLYRSNFRTLTFDDYGLDKLQKCDTELSWDEAYNKGLEDGRKEVWELANKIFDMDYHTTDEVFGCDTGEVMKMTPQEALAKLEAYEKEQKEIKVGDVVEATNNKKQYLVITEENDSSAFDFGVIDLNRMTLDRICNNTKFFKKTGKHIDISSILEQIGGGE